MLWCEDSRVWNRNRNQFNRYFCGLTQIASTVEGERAASASMVDINSIIEGTVKFRDGKKVNISAIINLICDSQHTFNNQTPNERESLPLINDLISVQFLGEVLELNGNNECSFSLFQFPPAQSLKEFSPSAVKFIPLRLSYPVRWMQWNSRKIRVHPRCRVYHRLRVAKFLK